jgi:hypothetical protein
MSGALIELVSKGVQDAYLTGDPQVSFYRQNYKRYTNFAMKPVELNKVGASGPNTEFTVPIEPVGDLLTYIWCDVTDIGNGANPTIQNSETKNPTEFALYIGGVEIDRQDAFFIDQLWPKFLATTPSKCLEPSSLAAADQFLPLHFFSCDNVTTPIPMVALQYHKVELRVRSGGDVGTSADTFKFYGNYIMLDTEERKWFAENEHHLLITQTQRINSDANGSDLAYLNHPVKGLFWGQEANDTLETSNVQLNLNGTAVFNTTMPMKYFNTVTMYQHSENAVPGAAGSITNDTSKYMYSFASVVNKHQPSGTCNFSRLDNAKFTWDGNGTPTYLYGVNYNILRVKDGLGGVMFSN